ncbi:hypothetical protein QAD02_023871 [Eretmocerus hayati]|uniref:Uncharacterized protein n=1 Tax=Eretmocerus hayati TaxID=131215 RepID=A0ACC2PZ87_9HYME|nr:hypothetical protein QAD02_023871 [Eretmocerus hayati]
MKVRSFELITISVFSLLACSSVTSLSAKTYPFHHFAKSSRKFIISKNIAKNDGLLLFALCLEEKLTSEINCVITKKKLPSTDDSETNEKACTFKSTLNGTMKDFKSLQIDSFENGNKAIISWIAQSGIEWLGKHVAILDMYSCSWTELNFTCYENSARENILISNVVVYDQSFVVIVSDPNKCKELGKCSITFDGEGKQIGEIKPFPTDLFTVRAISVSPESPRDGFFAFIGSSSMHPNVYHVEPQLLLSNFGPKLKLNSTVFFNSSLSKPFVSNAHNLFTVCGLENQIVHCNQFKIGELDPSIDKVSEITGDTVAVHNIVGGGYFLLSLYNEPESNSTYSRFNVTKIWMEENTVKTEFSSGGIKLLCSGNLDEIIVDIQDDGQDVCFYIACVREDFDNSKRSQSQITVREDCVSMSY